MSNLTGVITGQDAPSGRSQADVQEAILSELRMIRMALVMIATEGGLAVPDDFSPTINDVSDSSSSTL